VIRNPYDPISIMMVRGKRTFENAFEHYFASCNMLLDLHDQLQASEIFPIRYEEFIRQPEQSLEKICNFLGLEATPEYLQACASILNKSPERSRHLVKWETEWIEQVKSRMAQYNFLAGYSFEI
jgi:hypothetical protein